MPRPGELVRTYVQGCLVRARTCTRLYTLNDTYRRSRRYSLVNQSITINKTYVYTPTVVATRHLRSCYVVATTYDSYKRLYKLVQTLRRRTRRKRYAYRGACARLTPGARLFIGSYSQNTCYISVRDIPATLVDVFWRKAARSSHRMRRAHQERTPRVRMQFVLTSLCHSLSRS